MTDQQHPEPTGALPYVAAAWDAYDNEVGAYAGVRAAPEVAAVVEALKPLRSFLEVVNSPRHIEVKHERDGQGVYLSYGEWRAIATAVAAYDAARAAPRAEGHDA